MTRPRRLLLCPVVVALAFLACHPDGSGGSPVPGGPSKDPDSISRRGGNGAYGLDHKLLVLGVEPAQGSYLGGTLVLVAGLNFKQAGPVTEVLFGITPALSFTVRSNNQIDAISPPHAEGIVGITVRNADGEEASRADIFEFVAPDCLTLNPTSGPDTGGTPVMIETSDFPDDFTLDLPIVYFDTAQATSVVAIDATTIEAITPPDPNPAPPPNVHVVDVTVQSSVGQDSCTFPQGFTYIPPPPSCLTLNPTSGADTGGTPVTIETSGFADDFTLDLPIVYFDMAQATSVVAIDATTIEAITPPDPNPAPPPNVHVVDVTVQSSVGQDSCIFPQGFTYVGPTSPPCAYITPPGGPIAGGNSVIIVGMGSCQWTPNTTVTFGGVPAQIVSISATQIEVIAPPAPSQRPGAVDVEATGVTPAGPCTCLVPNGYTYQ